MSINPRQVEAFRAVMMTGSMTDAAEMLFVTQPAISRLIKDLENDLKFRLFNREGNKLIPTQEGTILFAEVDRFYVGFERIKKIAVNLRDARTGALHITAMNTLSLSYMTGVIKKFHSERPEVKVTLESHNSRSILELVAGRHFDIGFAQIAGEFPGINIIAMPKMDAVCIVPKSSELADQSVIKPEDFRGIPFISLGKNSVFRAKIDQMFHAHGVLQNELFQTSLAASAVGLVSSGLGVSIVDPFTAFAFKNDSLAIRPLSARLTFDVAAVIPSHRPITRLSNELLQIMRGLFRTTQGITKELN